MHSLSGIEALGDTMSWERMTAAERPSYLIGEAILRHFENARRDPEVVAEIAIICKVLETRLTDDELHHVVTQTGWDITGEFTEPETDRSAGLALSTKARKFG